MKIGKKLKALLKARGMTQTRLAELTGFRQSDISDWVNDLHLPRNESLEKIINVLGVSMAELADDKEPKLSDTDARLLAMQQHDKEMALSFIEFLHSKGYSSGLRERNDNRGKNRATKS